MKNRKFEISEYLKGSIDLLNLISGSYIDKIIEVEKICLKTLSNGNKIMICGNGGSAADAQHIACEFQIRLKIMRKALPTIALTTNSSILTAAGNDLGFSRIFSRQVEALGKAGDILLCISTSGESENIINALNTAKQMSITRIGFLGKGGGKALEQCDIAIVVPSQDTQHIQEAHITIGHIISEGIEKTLSRI